MQNRPTPPGPPRLRTSPSCRRDPPPPDPDHREGPRRPPVREAGAGGEDCGLTRRGFVALAATAAATAAVTTAAPAEAATSRPIYRIHPALGIARHGNADPSSF